MGIYDKMDAKFEALIGELSEKEASLFRKAKNAVFGVYTNLLKPLLIAILMFSVYAKLKDALGFENAIYIVGVSIVIFLRIMNSRLGQVVRILDK